MSADNFIAVWQDGVQWHVGHGNASLDQEDCMYIPTPVETYPTEGEALSGAAKLYEEEAIVEYGICPMHPATEPCGRCFVCINERGIIAEDIKRCTYCKKPISTSDWTTWNSEGQFHSYPCFQEHNDKLPKAYRERFNLKDKN